MLCNDRAVSNRPPVAPGTARRAAIDEFGARRLVGRDTEVAHLDAWLGDVLAGRSRPLLLQGEPGIGKTSLLRATCVRALELGIRPITVVPIPTARHLTLAGLEAVVEPLRSLLAVTDHGADALHQLMLNDLPADHLATANPLTLCGSLVSLLAAVAETQPVILVIDDAQWLDHMSADVIQAAFKGLILDRVGLLVAVLSAETHAFGSIQRLPIGGLSKAAAIELHASQRIDDDVLARCWDATGGNPLALDVLLRGIDESQRRGERPLPDPLPVADSIAAAFRRRVESLPASTVSALVVMAADLGLTSPVLARALVAVGCSSDDFEPAERAAILTRADGRLVFAHPLLRASTLATASAPQLRAANAALADAHGEAGDAERRAWHLAAAAAGPDREASTALAEAATIARRRGAIAVAAEGFRVAAQISPDRSDRVQRLLFAGSATWEFGQVDKAVRLASEALELSETAREVADASMLLGKIELWSAGPRVARDRFLSPIDALQPDERGLASRLLSQAAGTSVVSGDVRGALANAQRSLELAPPDDVATVVQAALTLGYVEHHSADAAGLERLQPIFELAGLVIDSDDPSLSGLMGMVGMCLTESEQFEEAERFLVAVARQARLSGATADSALFAAILAEKHWRTGDWLEAIHLISTDAVGGATMTVNRVWVAAIQARFDAAAGRAEACRERSALAVRVGRATSAGSVLIWAGHAMGLLEVGLGRWTAAARQLDRVAALTESLGRHLPGAVWWQGDHLEALVRSGRLDDARRALGRLDRERTGDASNWPACVAARCRGLLSDDLDLAIMELSLSIDLAQRIPAPFEAARSRLVRGERLLEAGDGDAACEDLTDALDAFERLGAASFAERTRRVLGEPLTTPAAVGLVDLLTPGELRVALAVARGKTNREVGADLFVSAKTIDYHLQNIYRKLNVRSRTELAFRVSLAGPE